MKSIDVLRKRYGKGRFTCGAVYIAFWPEGGDDPFPHIPLAKLPQGTEPAAPEWFEFAEAVVDLLNKEYNGDH